MLQGISRHKSDTKSLVAVGSNVASRIGPPETILRAAIDEISSPEVTLLSVSRLYRTPCIPRGAGPDYVNAAALVSTTLDAAGLLAHLHAVEARFDRERVSRWAARTLDLDLLDHGGALAPDKETWHQWRNLPFEQQKVVFPDRMILPHPRMQDRAFVLVPLMDIAPDWRHPITGRSVREMVGELTAGELAGITPVE